MIGTKTDSVYKPSKTAEQILFSLQAKPATWSSLQQKFPLTDTGLAKVLKPLLLSGALIKVECEAGCALKHDHSEGLYQITDVGLKMLARSKLGVRLNSDKLSAEQGKVFRQLFKKVLRLHREVLEKTPTWVVSEQDAVALKPKSEDQIVFVAAAELTMPDRSKSQALLVKFLDPHEFVLEKSDDRSLGGRLTLTKPVKK
jgi:hypothetical protein